MRICIDSNQFIFGISGSDMASETLMKLLPRLEGKDKEKGTDAIHS